MLTLVVLVIALLFLPAPWNVVAVVAAAIVDVTETAVFVWWSRRRRRLVPAAVGVDALVGAEGLALSRLDRGADGQVRVRGETWGARAQEPVDPGEQIVVEAVDGLVLDVRRPA